MLKNSLFSQAIGGVSAFLTIRTYQEVRLRLLKNPFLATHLDKKENTILPKIWCRAGGARIFAAALVIGLGVHLPAIAKPPQEIDDQFTSEKPLGTGQLSWLVFDAYTAELWCDAGVWSYDVPFALRIKYEMDFSKTDLIERTFKEIEGQQKLTSAQREGLDLALQASFPDVAENDTITAVYQPNGVTTFYHNGEETGTITDKTLSQRFFDIWLGEKTSEPKLRKKLLGL
jgi:hypothetical protein